MRKSLTKMIMAFFLTMLMSTLAYADRESTTILRTGYDTQLGQDIFFGYRILDADNEEVQAWQELAGVYGEGVQEGNNYNWSAYVQSTEGATVAWKAVVKQDGQADIWMDDSDRTVEVGRIHFSSWDNNVNSIIDEEIPPVKYAVTFNVDMSFAENFDPASDVVYFTGSLFSWAEPGVSPGNQLLTRVEDSMVWSKTIELKAGEYEYKYFINAGWDGGDWFGPPNRTVAVSEDITVNDAYGFIEFPHYYDLTLEVNPEDAGTVSGAGSILETTEVEVSATANEGFEFLNWTYQGIVINEDESFTFTMPAEDATLVANFVEEGTALYTLTLVSEPENAGVLIGGASFAAEAEVIISAIANASYIFTHWLKDGEIVSEEAAFSYPMPAENVTLVAVFEEDLSPNYGLRLEENAPTLTYWYTGATVDDIVETGEQFANNDLGAIDALYFKGASIKTWKTEGGDVTGAQLLYRVYSEGTDAPNYSFQNVRWTSNDGDGNQTWARFGDEINLTEGLASGSHQLEIMFRISGAGIAGITENGPFAASFEITQQSSLAEILSFSFEEETQAAFIDSENATVSTMVAHDASLEVLTPTIIVSQGANIDPASEAAQDFTSPIEYTVTAEDGTQKTWTVSVAHDEAPEPTFTVVFNVDMSFAENFDPASDVVYITGSLFGWAEPGVNPGKQLLTRVEDSMIWSKTLELKAREYEYKYFINAGWGGGDWIGPPNRIVAVSEDITVNDAFGFIEFPQYFDLTLEVNPENTGTVSGAGSILETTEVEVSATANEGFEFLNWTYQGIVINEDASFTFTMPAEDATLVANFVEEGTALYTLTLVSEPENAGILSGGASFAAEAEVNITAIANASYIFTHWMKDNEIVSEEAAFSYPMPAENVTLVAVFEEDLSPNYGLRLEENAPTLTYWYTGAAVDDIVETGEQFTNNNLGAIDALYFKGASIKTWKTEGGDVSDAQLQYRVYIDGADAPDYSLQNIDWTSDDSDGNQTWANFGDEINLTEGLASGSYQLEILFSISGAGIAGITENGPFAASFEITQQSNLAEILTFSFEEETQAASIDSENATVSTMVAQEVSLDALTPSITVSAGASINPESDVPQDFNTPVEYIVTAEDGSQKVWTVTVTPEEDIDTEFAVTFNVNMSFADDFDPENDVVHITGSILDWVEPGSDPENQMLSRVGESMIWSKTLVLEAGEYTYKYFLNDGWDGGEWGGDPNREIIVSEDMTINDAWGFISEEVVLSLQVAPADAGTLSGGGNVMSGTYVEISATANEGFIFLYWAQDGTTISEEAVFEYLMPEADVTLVAHFAEDTAELFSVTFVVQDDDGETLSDAIITLDNNTNPAGNYVFNNLLAGSYNYTIELEGYATQEGSIEIIDQDLETTIVLEAETPTLADAYDLLSFSIYPNPAVNHINIVSSSRIQEITIIDISGKEIYRTTSASEKLNINVSEFQSGMYFIRIQTVTATSVRKLQIR